MRTEISIRAAANPRGDPLAILPITLVDGEQAQDLGAVAADRGLLVSELVMEGEDPLRRLATVTQMLDYTSAYLGIACGLDPLASPARDDLRNLAERPEGGA